MARRRSTSRTSSRSVADSTSPQKPSSVPSKQRSRTVPWSFYRSITNLLRTTIAEAQTNEGQLNCVSRASGTAKSRWSGQDCTARSARNDCLPRNRELVSCRLSDQQNRTGSMVEHKSGDMSDRFRADGRLATVFTAGANDHQVGLPLGRNVDNLAFRSPLTCGSIGVSATEIPNWVGNVRSDPLKLTGPVRAEPTE